MHGALTAPLAPPAAETLARFWDAQQQLLADRLAMAVPHGARVALLDYPVHGNTGDHLILLGTERWAAQAQLEIVGRWHVDNVPWRSLPSDTILLCQGGGNFGDLYRFQAFRERLIAARPRQRIVLLPQTIHFRKPKRLRRSAEVFARHPDLHLFVRDHGSLEIAREWFGGCRPTLAPDMAAFLFPVADTLGCRLPPRPCQEMLRFFRRDRERTAVPPSGAGRAVDWDDLDPWGTPYWLGAVAAGYLCGRVIPADYASRTWFEFCRNRCRRAAVTLADHRRIVTNRMHCHILACLLGIPNVVHDNSYGKCSAYFRAWHAELPFTRLSV